MNQHMKLHEIKARRTTVEAEMRTLYDGAATAGEDLAGETLERWTALDTELTELRARQERAETRDAIDRTAEGKPLEQRGTADESGTAWALTPEQRMADYIKATTGQSAEGLSVGRAIRGALTGNWKDAEGEKRVMGSGVNTTGGFLIPDLVSANVIDLARNASVLIRAGAQTIPMSGQSLTLVRVLTDPTAAWRGEGQAIGESDATFDAILLSPSSLAALVRVNNELLDDVPNFAAQIDAQLAAALAVKLDYTGLYGSGVSSEPHGLRGAADVNEVSMGTNGLAQPDYDKILDLLQAVEEHNGAPDTLIQSPRSQIKLAKLKTGIASDLTKLEPPADYVALTKMVSNQVSVTETQGNVATASSTFIGGFSNMAFAIRQNITVEASRVSGDVFAKNQTLIRAILRADIAIYRPNHFGRLVGIL